MQQGNRSIKTRKATCKLPQLHLVVLLVLYYILLYYTVVLPELRKEVWSHWILFLNGENGGILDIAIKVNVVKLMPVNERHWFFWLIHTSQILLLQHHN